MSGIPTALTAQPSSRSDLVLLVQNVPESAPELLLKIWPGPLAILTGEQRGIIRRVRKAITSTPDTDEGYGIGF